MTPRIIILTQWFDPEPTFKGIVFARELVRKGFDVEVITGFPNYPGGKLYPGYRVKPFQREIIDGVTVTRLPLYPDHSQSTYRRILNYASFAASSLIYGLFFAKRADVIYAYHPPLTVGVVAALLRLLRRMPVVYDIQDMWPDTLKATGMLNNERLLKLIGWLCRWVYRRVDHIAVLSPGFKRLLIERGVSEDKIDVIYNWADEQSLAQPTGILPPGFPGPENFRVLFAGNMGRAQALGTVLEAAQVLERLHKKISFVLVGGGIEVSNLQRQAADMRLSNVYFFPPVPMNEIGTLLSSADLLLVHLRKDPLFQITIPSKTQAYMAVGKPILMGVDGDAAELVATAKAGLTFSSENADQLAQQVIILSEQTKESISSLGTNARAFYVENLSINKGVERFATIFSLLAEKSAQRRNSKL